MSISPPSDIVLGVASAADPEKYRAAMAQLQRVGDGAAAADNTAGAQFTVPPIPSEKTAAAGASVPHKNVAPDPSPAVLSAKTGTSTTTQAAAADRELKAYKQFEAFLMQTFIETMLPKDASTVYGSGIAGDMWRSMLAEHTATELTKTSVLGIAESIMKAKTKQKKSLTTVPVQQNTTTPGGLAASLSYLQSITGSNAQATTIAPSMAGALSRSGS